MGNPNALGRVAKPVAHDRGGGSKSSYTPEAGQPILDALMVGLPRYIAARVGGMSIDTFESWLRNMPSFAAAVEEAEARCQLGLVGELMKLARGVPPEQGRDKPDRAAIQFFLERRFHAHWKERVEATVKVVEDDPLEELERAFRDALDARDLQRLVAEVDAGAPDMAEARLVIAGAREPGSTGGDA